MTAQAAQADASLHELRQQVEKQQEQVFGEMKQQMQQVKKFIEYENRFVFFISFCRLSTLIVW